MDAKLQFYKILVTALFPLLISCAGEVVTAEKNENEHEYINSTINLAQTRDKLEGSQGYEVYFTLDRTVECISIALETVTAPAGFTDESVPVKSFFIVEKIVNIMTSTEKNQKAYIQLGRNYNNQWEVHNPLKICGNINDPVSRLDKSLFRVRFTTFDRKPFYLTITLYTKANVYFGTDPAVLMQESVPVK